MTPLFPRLAAAASLAIAASSTQAQPVNFVEVGNNVLANCVGGGVATSSSALGRMLVCSDNSGTGMASASASVGHVGASANSFAFQGTAAVNFGARANYFDTVTFSGPGAIPISTTLNLDFGGVINTPCRVPRGSRSPRR
jgi:hypothetical protein